MVSLEEARIFELGRGCCPSLGLFFGIFRLGCNKRVEACVIGIANPRAATSKGPVITGLHPCLVTGQITQEGAPSTLRRSSSLSSTTPLRPASTPPRSVYRSRVSFDAQPLPSSAFIPLPPVDGVAVGCRRIAGLVLGGDEGLHHADQGAQGLELGHRAIPIRPRGLGTWRYVLF